MNCFQVARDSFPDLNTSSQVLDCCLRAKEFHPIPRREILFGLGRDEAENKEWRIIVALSARALRNATMPQTRAVLPSFATATALWMDHSHRS